MSDHPHTREAIERWRQGKINVFDALAELEDQRDKAIAALHQCFAATGEDAGDMGDFWALVDRERHTVNAVREMREQLDRAESEREQWRECAEFLATALQGLKFFCEEDQAFASKAYAATFRHSNAVLAEFQKLKGAAP